MELPSSNFPSQRAETPLGPRKWSRKKKIITVALSAGALLFFLNLVWGYRAIGYKPVTGRYVNASYEFSIRIPEGWRLATSVMHSLNSRFRSWWEMVFYTYKHADFVVLTAWDFKNELVLSNAIDRLSLKGLAIPYAKMLSGSYILIDVADGIDYETAVKLSKAPPNSQQPRIRNLQKMDLSPGVTGARYTLMDDQSPDKQIETVFIPYPKETFNALKEKVVGITIRTLRDGAFSESVFSQFLESFSYLHE